ncbi:hypothetical protein TSAR_005930 [Trichomalopsis sarcophagae]|uniref:Uncharacterized protein n=1 Tax=Trichomalopsis sarcophagae TaxID=543379 RepID=A0A232FCS3_9HYME|nr:hypothetical protein TSAR_005930 [Trichomalopsis sarcophagae]
MDVVKSFDMSLSTPNIADKNSTTHNDCTTCGTSLNRINTNSDMLTSCTRSTSELTSNDVLPSDVFKGLNLRKHKIMGKNLSA